MAAWLTVYATRPVLALTAESLTELLKAPILGDIGEGWGFDYDGTLTLLRNCEVQLLEECRDETYSILVPERRPIDVPRLVDAERLAEERDEALEGVDALSVGARKRVEATLTNLSQVVMFELGWPALDREEFVGAWFIALELAESAQGLVQDFEGAWWDPADWSNSLS